MNSLELDERGVIVPCPQCGKSNRIPYERLSQSGRCAVCTTPLPAPDEPIEIGTEEEFAALIRRSTVPVLVDFWAPWCGPCKMMAPEVAVAVHQADGRWIAAKLNTDEVPEPGQQLNVSSIPLLVIFKGGREIARSAGARPASAIKAFVEQHL